MPLSHRLYFAIKDTHMIKKISTIVSYIIFAVVQSHAGLSITPARVEVLNAPGTCCEGKYTVRNDYPGTARIAVGFRDWFVLPENGNIPVSGWVSVKPAEFVLKSGKSRDVHYTVHIPTVAKGVSVGMVSFTPTVENDQGITTMMSVSLYVTAAGTEKLDWKIDDVKLSKAASEFTVTAIVSNSGNVHVRPTGRVTIVDGNSAPVFTMNIPEGRPVYPGSYRAMTATTSTVIVFKEGEYSAIVTVSSAGEQKTQKIDFIINKMGEATIK
jgi:hypothetical protein